MYDYETSEQLFIDIWKKYGSPDEVDDADIIRRVQAETIGQRGECEHEHLERDDHGEDKKEIAKLRDPVIHTGDEPRAHRAANEDEHDGADRDDQTVPECGKESLGGKRVGKV